MEKAPASAVFTLRDLNRQPAKVFDAVRKFGSVEIRTRRGERFTIVAKTEEPEVVQEFPDFRARWSKLRELGLVPPSQSESERVNQIIAGEV